MGDALPDGAWVVRAHLKPFVNWIWLGCVLMALGGFAAALDARYRRAALRRAAPANGASRPA
jgi:cytochrome c-type biogenesis protein CcmF